MRKRRFGTLPVRQEHWEPHETVTIKALNTAEVAHINDVTAGIDANGTPIPMMGRAQLYSLVFGIAAMTLTDEGGVGLPWPHLYDKGGTVIPEALAARLATLATLDPGDSTFIHSELNKLNTPKSKEEQESFLASYAPGTAASPPDDHPMP